MYRSIAVLGFLGTLAPLGATAQTSFELHGGATSWSYDAGSAGSSDESSSGFVAGAAIRIDVGSSFRLRTGVEYARRRGVARNAFGSDPSGDEFVQSRLNQGYLVVPLAAEFRGSLGATVPFASLGPEVAFEVACSFDADVIILDDLGRVVGEESRDGLPCGDGTSTALLGLRAGGGIEVPVSESVRLVVRGHYLLGLTDAFDSPGAAAAKLRSLELSAGLVFGAGARR